jgi:hypothetical protein
MSAALLPAPASTSGFDSEGCSHVPLLWLLPPSSLLPSESPSAAPAQPDAHPGLLCADVPHWWRGGEGGWQWRSCDLFLCVGSESSGLLPLLLSLCCRVASLQSAGRALRSALPAFRAAGHRHLEQPVLILLCAHGGTEGEQLQRAGTDGRLTQLRRRLAEMQPREREGWPLIQVREFSSLQQLDGFLLSACWSLPLPPRLVLVDELPAPPAEADCRQSSSALSSTLQAARQLLDETMRRAQQPDSGGLLPCQLFLSLQTDSGGGCWLRSSWLPPRDVLSSVTHRHWREILTAAPLAAPLSRLSVLPACRLPQGEQAAALSVDYSRQPAAADQQEAAGSAAAPLAHGAFTAAAGITSSVPAPSPRLSGCEQPRIT